MKNKKKFRNITIIISIIVLLINIGMYIKLNSSFDSLSNLENSLERAGGLIGVGFYWGTFIWGIISLILIWIEYFFIMLTIKVFNKLAGVKKWILFSLLGIIVLGLLLLIIRIINFMILVLCI